MDYLKVPTLKMQHYKESIDSFLFLHTEMCCSLDFPEIVSFFTIENNFHYNFLTFLGYLFTSIYWAHPKHHWQTLFAYLFSYCQISYPLGN